MSDAANEMEDPSQYEIQYVYANEDEIRDIPVDEGAISNGLIENIIYENGLHGYMLNGEYFVTDIESNDDIPVQVSNPDDLNLFYLNGDEPEERPLAVEQTETYNTDLQVDEIINIGNNIKIVRLVNKNDENESDNQYYLVPSSEEGDFKPESLATFEPEQFLSELESDGSDRGQPDAVAERDEKEEFDALAKITGKNLITGQQVTLHSHMAKLKRKLQAHDFGRKKAGPVDGLIDKRIDLGRTKSGKKIVGKILHVARKQPEPAAPPAGDAQEPKVVVKKSIISKESFEDMAKTLGGVMEMESVRKKLENRNIVVKLIEKRYVADSDSWRKTTSYSYGYMVVRGAKWGYVPDLDTQNALLSQTAQKMKFAITTNLTVIITYGKNDQKTIKVNLNPAPGNLCTICAQYFRTNLNLRQHMNTAHNTYGNQSQCQVCGESFVDYALLDQHTKQHVVEGRLFVCGACKRSFTTLNRLQKHQVEHGAAGKGLACAVCNARCLSEATLRKHVLLHAGVKPYRCEVCAMEFASQYEANLHRRVHAQVKLYTCNICSRSFGRHSNLMRHATVHKGPEQPYKCGICDCSFNFISSLTRHVVQNHVNAGDLAQEVNNLEVETSNDMSF